MCMNDGEKGRTRIGRDIENRARYEVASGKAACIIMGEGGGRGLFTPFTVLFVGVRVLGCL
jgi:hypothetical protein